MQGDKMPASILVDFVETLRDNHQIPDLRYLLNIAEGRIIKVVPGNSDCDGCVFLDGDAGKCGIILNGSCYSHKPQVKFVLEPLPPPSPPKIPRRDDAHPHHVQIISNSAVKESSTKYPHLAKEVSDHDYWINSSWYNLSDEAFEEFKQWEAEQSI